MAKDRLNLGIIGTGRIGRAHLAAAEDLKDKVRVVAVTNRRREKAEAAREVTAIDRIHDETESLLADPDVDAVIICLPFALHHETALAAIRAGKHVMVEKPMTATADQAAEVVAAAKDAGRTVMVGQSRRFSDAARKAHDLRPRIGTIFRMVTNFMVRFAEPPTDWWSDTGELIMPLQGSHYIDFALWMKEEVPESVFSRTRRFNPVFGASDEGDILMEFSGAASASVHLSLSTNPHVHETILVGTDGVLKMAEYATGVPFGIGTKLWLNDELIHSGDQSPGLYTVQLAEFADALKEDRTPIADAASVLPVMDVLEAAGRSQTSGSLETVRRRS